MKLLLIFPAILLFLFLCNYTFAQVVVNEILMNAQTQPDGEWIELYNNGTTEVNISGWKVGDNAQNFTIPINTSLLPNEFLLLVYNQTITNVSGVKIIEYGASAANLKLADSNDAVYLFNNFGELVDSYSWNSSKKNVSQGRYPDGFEWKNKLFPTPGTKNLPSPQNVKLSVYLPETVVVGVLYSNLFYIKIEEKNCSLKDFVTVRYNITDRNGSLIKDGNFTREVSCDAYADTGEWLPDVAGEYSICGEIVNSTVNEVDFSDNFACKNVSVVEVVSILDKPKAAKFGDLKFINLKLDTTAYEYEKVRFLVYGKSKRVVSDLSWNKISKYADCSGDLSVEANLTKNQSYFFSVPFFIYPNCDSYYSDGEYEITLRICKPAGSNWEKYLEYTFNLLISGKNDKLCPQPEIRTIVQTLKVSENTSKSNLASNLTKEENYKIIFSPPKVRPGEEFNVTVLLKNPTDSDKSLTIYSYVFEGKTLLSEGLDENGKWRKTWTANERKVLLKAHEEKQINLTNRIKLNVKPGEYDLRVRIKGEKDLVTSIEVLKPINASLRCRALNESILAIITNLGDEANFTLVAKTHNKTEEFSLSEEERKEFNLPLLNQNSFLLIYEGKIIDSCFYKKEKELVERKEDKSKGTQESITGMFTKTTNFIASLFYKLFDFLRGILKI
jgi:hypothetical protein